MRIVLHGASSSTRRERLWKIGFTLLDIGHELSAGSSLGSPPLSPLEETSNLRAMGYLLTMPSSPLFQPTKRGRYETLPDDDCERLLDALENKNNGCVLKLSAELTPFVKALYDGEEYYPASRHELITALSWNKHRSTWSIESPS